MASDFRIDAFLMMEQQLTENPGQLLPMQTSGNDEWDFYLDVLEKLDLPPDTGAVLITPSAFKEMKVPGFSRFRRQQLGALEKADIQGDYGEGVS